MGYITLFVFIFLCYGFSNIVVYSNGPFDICLNWRKLSEKIHPKFGELFSCMMCFPMWAGMLFSVINLFCFYKLNLYFTPMNYIFGDNIFNYTGSDFWLITAVVILLDGFVSSGTTWVIHNIEEYFETRK
jgi:hypothetical protein